MKHISIDTLEKTYDLNHTNSNIVIIDVREPSEYAHEHIAHALHVPLKDIGNYDFSAHKHKIALFHCRSGNRTSINAQTLSNTPFSEKFCIEGGLEAWKSHGLPVQKNVSAPIDIMRQVQIIVSIMILGGLALAHWFSPLFLVLPAIAGVGMGVAGTTGFCGMAIMLQYMPWNRNRSVTRCNA